MRFHTLNKKVRRSNKLILMSVLQTVKSKAVRCTCSNKYPRRIMHATDGFYSTTPCSASIVTKIHLSNYNTPCTCFMIVPTRATANSYSVYSKLKGCSLFECQDRCSPIGAIDCRRATAPLARKYPRRRFDAITFGLTHIHAEKLVEGVIEVLPLDCASIRSHM